ncbi:MAG: hypothetical protein V3S12_00005, partial [Acidiferrobacterales bacterium]
MAERATEFTRVVRGTNGACCFGYLGGYASGNWGRILSAMKRIGGFIWTACSAAWLVLAWATSVPEAAFVGIGCAVLAI